MAKHILLVDDDDLMRRSLAFTLEQGECSVDICTNFHIILPEDGAALADIDLSRDLVTEFHEELEALSKK